jgi:phosphate-selective porin OprO/OprP
MLLALAVAVVEPQSSLAEPLQIVPPPDIVQPKADPAPKPEALPALSPAPDQPPLVIPVQIEPIPAAAEAKPYLQAVWDDGFYLRTTDQQFQLRLTGQIQSDYRQFLDTGDRFDVDTFQIRRARFGLEANLLKYYEFRFLPEFGQGQTRLQDSYINVHYWDAFQVEGGKFKQPFSYEQLIQDRFVPFMERSLIDQLVPARDIGIMLHGEKLLGDRVDWGMSYSNGEINGDTDNNDLKDFAARIVVRPFKGIEALSFLDLLQIGIAGTTGVQQEQMTNFVLRTPAGVPFFSYLTTVRADGLRNRWSPEASYFLGGFGIAAQYFHQNQVFRAPNGTTLVNVPATGFYVMATYLLTGEKRTTYSEAIDPIRPFDPRPGCMGLGAWELVARVSRLNLGGDVFAPGSARLADPTRYSRGATEMTLGFNWYLNKWVRTQFNWEHSWFDQPVQLGPAKTNFFRHEDALTVRLQIIF